MTTCTGACFALVAMLSLVPTRSLAQQQHRPARLGTVLSAFLADSAARTLGLAWTSGSTLTVKWQSAKPVTNTDRYLSGKGMTLSRTGTILVALDKEDPIEVTVQVLGSAGGIQRTNFWFSYHGDFDADPKDRVDRALAAEGFKLSALKCDRKTEGVMFGNVAYIAKAPRKTASALWESWNCTGAGECTLTLTLLYRKSDVAEVECASP